MTHQPREASSSAAREPAYRNVTDLVHARLQERLSRRELIERARDLGLAAPVIGLMLHLTGDSAAAAPDHAIREAIARIKRELPRQPVPATKRTAPRGEPLQGGTLVAGTVGKIDTLTPYVANLYGQSFDVLSGIMEGLLAIDSKQRLRPALARRFEVSDDGLVYTFQLRQEVKFHNGDRFTAQDVVKTWEMIVNQDLPAWSRLGWEKIKDISVPDSQTIVVTTTEIYAPFLANIAAGAFNNGVISPVRQLKKAPERFVREFSRRPVGTGPLRFVENDGDVVVLERFRDYWGSPAKLSRVVVRLFPDHDAQLEALRRGEIQIAGRLGTPSHNVLPEALAIDGVTVLEFPGLTWGHLDLKHISFLRETAVRQALDYATPKERIVKEILGGRGIPAFADQSPGSWVYHPRLKPRPYDLQKARSLLYRAGLRVGADGVRERDGERLAIELWGEASDPQAPQILNLIAESWRQIGVATTVKLAPAATLWGPTGYQFTDRMTAGYYRWSNFNDPDDMFYWHSSQIPTSPTGPGGNLPAYFYLYNFQKRIDDLTARAAAEIDTERRKELYWEIQELLHKEVPVIFLFWDKGYAAAANTVGGFWPSAFNYLLWNVKDWYLTAQDESSRLRGSVA
jgi:peptide/nickel transport system substrate-binding protein